jgi:glutamate 5-kinase
MYSKLLAARRAAQLGVPTFILPGREPRVITRAFDGEELGTWVRPETQSVSRRKYWLAYQSDPQGGIEVDEGAAKALVERGSRRLPGGVCRVEGNFQPAALVRIHIQGRTLGVGLSNYSAADLRRIMGRPRLEVAALLGDAHYPEVIHRDNMLIDAAV